MAGDHAGGAGAEPVWAGGADAYQLRLDRRPRALRARFVNATGSATAADRVRTAVRRAAHARSRRSRAARRRPSAHAARPAAARRRTSSRARRGAPTSARPARHRPTARCGSASCTTRSTPTRTRAQDSAAIVLSICRYHRDENGWRDIGYNFLVDRFGQIFEGRAGGIDQPVIGAQAQGYNAVSTGVANLGTFSQAPQTAAGLSATAELLAWKLSLHGAPVEGRVTVTSAGGPTNRHPVGTPVTFERIAAHRNADKTRVPRRRALRPAARDPRAGRPARAAVRVPGAGRHALPAVARRHAGLPAARPAGGLGDRRRRGPLPGAPIAVQIATSRGFTTVARATTGADGGPGPRSLRRSTRGRCARSRSCRAARSSPRRILEVQVAPQLRLRAPKRVTARRRFTVRGSVSPRRARLVLEIARQGSRPSPAPGGARAVNVRGGRFTDTVRLRRPACTECASCSPATGATAPRARPTCTCAPASALTHNRNARFTRSTQFAHGAETAS